MHRSIKLAVLIFSTILPLALLLSNTYGDTSRNLQPIVPNGPDRDGLPAQKRLDPAAWGTNHSGKPVPEFVHGDECLFCHRNDIGPGWQKNTHGITIRQKEDAPEWRDIFKG